MFDVAVIGGGVAGLTAALFAARHGRSTLAMVQILPGGHLCTIDKVEDFPGFPNGVAGYELGPAMQEQAANAGAEFLMADAERIAPFPGGWRVDTTDGEVEARAVIIASGSHPRLLGVPGEDRLQGRGISQCASCDGPLLRGKPVTVAGAGDSALQEALTLAEFTDHVLLVHTGDQPAAQHAYRQRLAATPAIHLRPNTTVAEVLGDEAVTGLRLRDTATGATEVVETAALFPYIGLEPNTAFLAGLLPIDPDGRIATDIWMRTAVPGLFAAGDVRAGAPGQAITAAGDGATAAIAAHRYLLETDAH